MWEVSALRRSTSAMNDGMNEPGTDAGERMDELTDAGISTGAMGFGPSRGLHGARRVIKDRRDREV